MSEFTQEHHLYNTSLHAHFYLNFRNAELAEITKNKFLYPYNLPHPVLRRNTQRL